MKKTNFFDAEFECKCLETIQNNQATRFESFVSTVKLIGITCLATLVLCMFGLLAQIISLENELKFVQQEQVQMSCETEANKIGVGYTFINKGEETECLLHYVD